MNARLARCLGTFFYLGRIPYAPGTFGSAAGIAIFGLCTYFLAHGEARLAFGLLCACVLLLAALTAFEVETAFGGEKDPRSFVLDEVAGQMLVFTLTADFPRPSFPEIAAAGFILFRFFDIVKPGVVGRLDKSAGIFGVIADDLAAGAFSAILLNIYVFFRFYSG